MLLEENLRKEVKADERNIMKIREFRERRSRDERE